MKLINTLKFLVTAKNQHFLSVDGNFYKKWKHFIRISLLLNPNYKSCEIYRKKYKNLKSFVVVGLKFSGKNVKRRTSGWAKEILKKNRSIKCIYCEVPLTNENATADHIVPISNGGNNCQVNLVICCENCNIERGNIEFNSFLVMKNLKYKRFIYI